ncbi:uncharacterized protein LOC127096248 [Lathyrus oleraceus]|uniref:uncharacterized protein LOC127096248 n=1 Tax=Pisum sativum TaxID=3888 RepID=UPI0021CF7BFC|nr:uncharacterized protein LOC127096248 [Pisum sativum]
MAQFANRVRQVERLKAEKVRTTKFSKKKTSYVKVNNIGNSSDSEYECVEENEVNVAELKSGRLYTCKLLQPSNGKNPIEPKNKNKNPSTYTFDITKCDKKFDLLVTYGEIVVPKGTKVPLLEQRKKKGFCKFQSFLDHNTSQCVLFRDPVQNALKDGKLKFADKQKPHTKEDNETKNDVFFVELVDIMVVDTITSTGG